MHVLLTGSSGWLGRFLAPRLRAAGHRVSGLDIAEGPDTDHIGSVADPTVVRAVFDRGVDVVGSIMVCDLPRLEALLEAGQPWAEGTAKYCITRDQYPGIRKMIRTA